MSGSFSAAQIAATVVASAATSSGGSNHNGSGNSKHNNNSKNNNNTRPTPLWEQSAEQLDTWINDKDTTNLLQIKIPTKNAATQELQTPDLMRQIWKTLQGALETVYLQEIIPNTEEADNNGAQQQHQEEQQQQQEGGGTNKPARKRRKRIKMRLVDPFNLWVHVKRIKEDESTATSNTTAAQEQEHDDSDIDVPLTAGGKLSVLSVGGLLNGMAGIQGGVTKRVTPSEDSIASVGATTTTTTSLPLVDYLGLAHAWHGAIQKQVHLDILSSTPRRIQDMLCPDLTDTEFASIRKRIFDTVVMGKGLHTNDPTNLDVDKELAVGPSAMAHDIEKFKKCQICGNNDQASFVVDRKNGDVICSNCGTIVSESIMHEGSQFRKFEGEVDRNHHGDTPNPLYSNAHNLSTSLSGVSQTTGAGMGGWRSSSNTGGGRNLETILRNAHAYTELNISQFGRTDRRTRVGYKDRQKKEAFVNMAHTGDALNLHEAVVQRAKELFAGFRDDRELVQQFKGVIAACLCEAFDQLSDAGKQILKAEQGQGPEQVGSNPNNDPASTSAAGSGKSAADTAAAAASSQAAFQYNKRAARRNELHHSNLAGRGGLLLDFDSVEPSKSATAAAKNSPSNAEAGITTKPVPTWDLEDCRRWLTDVPQQISSDWIEAREKGSDGIPSGTQADLEGRLVEHTFNLIEYLETQMQSKQTSNGKKVVTPRLNDLAKLGIQWQHKHERGAGSKSLPQANKSKRKAGQILILLTAKKLGSILKDPVAGDAIHKKLREVVSKQETLKLQGLREEASRQRLLQMKRKPWLQARLQS